MERPSSEMWRNINSYPFTFNDRIVGIKGIFLLYYFDERHFIGYTKREEKNEEDYIYD